MSQRRMFTRGMTGAVALAGALALALPGVANAAPPAKPTVTSQVSGKTITIKIDSPAGVDCTPSVISPIAALPLVTGNAGNPADLPGKKFGEPSSTGDNTWTTGTLPDGIYAVVGTCEIAGEDSTAYTFAFIPGSILGSIPQLFNLGSTVITMDGGMDLIMQLIGSDMLGGQGSSDDGATDPGTTDPGTADPDAGDTTAPGPLDGFDLGSLSDLLGGGAADAGTGGGTNTGAGN